MLEIANPWICQQGHKFGDPEKVDVESGIMIAVDASARKWHFPPQWIAMREDD